MSFPDRKPTACEIVVRPAGAEDLTAIHALIVESAGALERFDDSLESAEKAIDFHLRSIQGLCESKYRNFLLLAEEVSSGEIVGCIAVACQVGLDQPFYNYRIGKIVHSSQPLKSYRCLDLLYLSNDLTGSSEIHSLYVRQSLRKKGVARQLFNAVQLFIATRPQEFAPRIIAELRGIVDDKGRSPFWDAVGRHFFKVDQGTAEKMVAKGRKAFIAELMPKHPVYLTLLPSAAQSAVGGVHADLAALLPHLDSDGFHFESHVDIFDGGRVIEARTHELRGVANGRTFPPLTGKIERGQRWWIASGEGADFRMIGALAAVEGPALRLDQNVLNRVAPRGAAIVKALPA